MKKLYLGIILGICLLLATAVIAQSIKSIDKTGAIPQDKLDALKSKVKVNCDVKGKCDTPVINPKITYTCDSKEYKGHAFQDGIIQTDEVLARDYCIKQDRVCTAPFQNIDENNKTFTDCAGYETKCIQYGTYSCDELNQQFANMITEKLKSYADTIIADNNKDKAGIENGEGTINYEK